jgi:hypothetical protein
MKIYRSTPKLDSNRNECDIKRWLLRRILLIADNSSAQRCVRCQSRVSPFRGKERNKILAGVRLMGTKLLIQCLKISCRKLESAGRQTNMLWVPGMTV